MNLLSRIRYLFGTAPVDATGNWWAVSFLAVILPFAGMVAFSLTAGATPSVAMADDKFDEANTIEKTEDNLDESATIKKIELLAGKVLRDENLPGSPVTEVDLSGNPNVNDKDVYLLKSLPSLTTLNLCQTKITDVGLKHIRQLGNLESLDLGWTRITSVGLKDISQFKNLTKLYIKGVQNITDMGVDEFRQSRPTLEIMR